MHPQNHVIDGSFLPNTGVAGKSPNFYVYAHNSPMLVKDPTGRIIPAIAIAAGYIAKRAAVGAAVGATVGAVKNVAVYIATSKITGSEITLEGTKIVCLLIVCANCTYYYPLSIYSCVELYLHWWQSLVGKTTIFYWVLRTQFLKFCQGGAHMHYVDVSGIVVFNPLHPIAAKCAREISCPLE